MWEAVKWMFFLVSSRLLIMITKSNDSIEQERKVSYVYAAVTSVLLLSPLKCHSIKLLPVESNTANPAASSDARLPTHSLIITARRANTPAGTAQRQCDALVLTHTNTQALFKVL